MRENGIITKLDEDLRNIAQSTGGQFLSIGPTGEGISYVFSELQAFGHKKMHEQFSTTLPVNRYQVFVLIGLFFLFFRVFNSIRQAKAGGWGSQFHIGPFPLFHRMLEI